MPNPVSVAGGLDNIFAAGRVIGATGLYGVSGAGANAQTAAYGAAGAIVRNGAGSWTITLAGGGIDTNQMSLKVLKDGIGATNTAEIQATMTSGTTLDVRAFSAGAATDCNFWFEIRRLGR